MNMQALVFLANPLNADLAGVIVRLVRQLRETAATRVQAVWRGLVLRHTLSMEKEAFELNTWLDRTEVRHTFSTNPDAVIPFLNDLALLTFQRCFGTVVVEWGDIPYESPYPEILLIDEAMENIRMKKFSDLHEDEEDWMLRLSKNHHEEWARWRMS